MLVSILHRVTGGGLSVVGAALLVWWLVAAANGPAAYEQFTVWATWPWALIVWVPLSWALFQHTLSGVRHLVMDMGVGYELSVNKLSAILTLAGSVVLTGLLWAYILGAI
jgi:succinate dehydrogenase / fumarate reductase cytochrome b subunit